MIRVYLDATDADTLIRDVEAATGKRLSADGKATLRQRFAESGGAGWLEYPATVDPVTP